MAIPFKNDIQVLGLTILGNYTTAERIGLSIGVPEAGAIVFDTTAGELYRWDGTAWNLISTAAAQNLSIGTVTATTAAIDIDQGGTSATIPAATNSTAGVATATQITNLEALVALDGVPPGVSDLGTFTGTIIPDAQTIKAALQALETDYETFKNSAGVANGLATLNGSGVIPNSQLPNLAISDVFVEATIASRDLLAASWGADEEGDTVIVTDAGADPNVPSGESATYLWDGAAFQRIVSGANVTSVNGATGVVVLTASDIGATPGAAGTPTAGATDVQAQLDALNAALDPIVDEDNVHIESFALIDWTGPTSGAYTLTVPQATHGLTSADLTDATPQEEVSANVFRRVFTRTDVNTSTGDVTLTVRAVPDARFVGRVIIKQDH